MEPFPQVLPNVGGVEPFPQVLPNVGEASPIARWSSPAGHPLVVWRITFVQDRDAVAEKQER